MKGPMRLALSVCRRQPDGFALQLKHPADLLGSDVYRTPAMFWFKYALEI